MKSFLFSSPSYLISYDGRLNDKQKTANKELMAIHANKQPMPTVFRSVSPLSTDGTKFFDGFSVGLAAGMPLGAGFRKSVKVA